MNKEEARYKQEEQIQAWLKERRKNWTDLDYLRYAKNELGYCSRGIKVGL